MIANMYIQSILVWRHSRDLYWLPQQVYCFVFPITSWPCLTGELLFVSILPAPLHYEHWDSCHRIDSLWCCKINKCYINHGITVFTIPYRGLNEGQKARSRFSSVNIGKTGYQGHILWISWHESICTWPDVFFTFLTDHIVCIAQYLAVEADLWTATIFLRC